MTNKVGYVKADELNPADKQDNRRALWIAYCAFHLADYSRALQVRSRDITYHVC